MKHLCYRLLDVFYWLCSKWLFDRLLNIFAVAPVLWLVQIILKDKNMFF